MFCCFLLINVKYASEDACFYLRHSETLCRTIDEQELNKRRSSEQGTRKFFVRNDG